MNVAHITLSFQPGGRREAIRTLVEEQASLGVTSHLICLEDLGIDPDDLGKISSHCVLHRQSVFDISAAKALRDRIDSLNLDLIHSHDAASQLTVATARSIGARIPHVSTFHRSLNSDTNRFHKRLLAGYANLLTEVVLVASTERLQHYRKANWVRNSKVRSIPLGIDLTRFAPSQEKRAAARQELGVAPEDVVLGAIGHFGQEKGIDLVVKAGLRLLDSANSPIRIVILGSGTDAQVDSMKALVPEDKKCHFDFLGHVPDPGLWLNAFDVFVHGARLEAFGLVVVEAMACALPVVTAGVGGITDIVLEGETGFLCGAGSHEALAGAAGKLIKDGALRNRMGAASLERAISTYAAHRYATHYHEVYQELTNWGAQATTP